MTDHMRRTKIIATVGPASNDAKTLKQLINEGVDVFRFNLSHSTHAQHKKTLAAIRKVSKELNTDVGILFDLAGQKLRIGNMKKPVEIKRGQEITLTKNKVMGTGSRISVNHNYLIKELSKGDKILIDEGRIELKIKRKTPAELICTVKQGGVLSSNKGINVTAPLSLKPLTKKDREDIKFAIENKVDWLALSFVRHKSDISDLKAFIKRNKAHFAVMAKIEKKEAVSNIDEIIEASDGIMIARGDLGVEMPVEDVPLIQKTIIEKCMQKGKAVVTATQMLESMINNRRPTRAEVNDIANAIFDQSDAVMLSAETAAGKYPVAAVKTMAKVAGKTESAIDYAWMLRDKEAWVSADITDAISFASCELVRDLGAALLVTSTQSGATAARVAAYRPPAPILAATPDKRVMNRLKLIFGVVPYLINPSKNINDMLAKAKQAAKQSSLVRKNDKIVITAGALVNVVGTTNLIKVETID
ncbi:hypothetical protein LCGC14_1267540 [marine sediment metagenome]|uniref:pyruvate kinase n=1 Tax=marine sediment metagenome TaxID=412755 RepID=A0A0F9P282_9ZZZZ|nr:pyruvate kinase [Actinomycetota bacterium]